MCFFFSCLHVFCGAALLFSRAVRAAIEERGQFPLELQLELQHNGLVDADVLHQRRKLEEEKLRLPVVFFTGRHCYSVGEAENF